jgi:Zn-dependent protease with chaperone function
MARLKVRPLTEVQVPALMSMLHDESGAMAIAKYTSSAKSTVYCAPTALQATAFTLGGFRPKLVVTGRLCIAASTFPQETRLILRHELAHLDNHDMWLWQVLICGVVMAIPSLFIGADQLGFSGTRLVIRDLLGLPIGFYLLLLCFRRREFMADAIAVNHTEDRTKYLNLLQKAQLHQKSWFHPSPADRIAAIQCDSPVLRTSTVLHYVA